MGKINRFIRAAVCCSMVLGSAASAQELIFPQGLQCLEPSPQIFENFERNHGEIPMLQGKIILTSLQDNNDYVAEWVMLVNPKNGNWTQLAFFKHDNVVCMLGVGTGLKPVVTGVDL